MPPKEQHLPHTHCRQCGNEGLILNFETKRRRCPACGHVTVAQEAYYDISDIFNEDRRRGR